MVRCILIFYTQEWKISPTTIELECVPLSGNIIWLKEESKPDDSETDMYYVDNIMYPEHGINAGDPVYLFVRPYKGYTTYGPLTESDRVISAVKKVQEEMQTLLNEIHDLHDAFEEQLADLREISEDIHRMSSDVNNEQSETNDKLESIIYRLEEIKERM